jgi:hypothetical protein
MGVSSLASTTVQNDYSVQTQGKPFSAVLREAVTVGLVEVLGSAGARATMFYVDLADPTNVKKIHAGLVKVFGAGTASLETSILRELFSRIGRRYDPEGGRTFADYVLEAKSHFSKDQEGGGER